VQPVDFSTPSAVTAKCAAIIAADSRTKADVKAAAYGKLLAVKLNCVTALMPMNPEIDDDDLDDEFSEGPRFRSASEEISRS
jgi:hypothetical protein